MKNYIFLFISILFFTSCRKVSVENYENPNTDLISQFFLTKTKPTKLVYQIMQDLKQKNTVNDLELNKFIKKEGFALWDKCVITIKQNNYRRGLNDANLDTVVLVPLALPETETVKSYLEVHINSNIQYELQKQSEYKNYAYGQLKSDNKNAERFALEFMILNSKVFKYSRFKITDKDLFKTDLNTNTSNENNTFYILRIPNINSQAESFDQVNDCYEMEEWYNPNGDECNCSGDEYFTGNTYWVGDCFNGGGGGGGFGSGFGLGLGGSSDPGGSGSGGWAPINTYNLEQQLNAILGPGDSYAFLPVNQNDLINVSSVAEFKSYLENLNATTTISNPTTVSLNEDEKTVSQKIYRNYVGGYVVNFKVKRNTQTNKWELLDVTSGEIGLTPGWEWEQDSYNKSTNQNEIIVNWIGYERYNLFLDGVGVFYSVQIKYQTKINIFTGEIISTIKTN